MLNKMNKRMENVANGKMQKVQNNLTEGPDKVISDETSFEQRRKQLIAQWKHVQQPKSATDSNCLIVSLLNCVETDEERNILLGMERGAKVEYTKSNAYSAFHQWCDQRQSEGLAAVPAEPEKPKTAKGKLLSKEEEKMMEEWEALVSAREEKIEKIKNERYTAEGVYAWLEHLKGLGKIQNFIWRRAHAFDGHFSEWFSARLQKHGVGKKYVVFGYHGKGQGKDDISTRLLGLAARKRGREEDEDVREEPKQKRPRKKNSIADAYKKRTSPQQRTHAQKRDLFQQLIDNWATRKIGPPPVDVLMGADDVAVSARAWELTHMGAAGEKCTALAWRLANGRSLRSCQEEECYHKAGLIREAAESLRANMHARDETQGNDGEVAEKSAFVWGQPLRFGGISARQLEVMLLLEEKSAEQLLKRGEVSAEELLELEGISAEARRATVLHAQRMNDMKISRAGGIVTRHGIAARVVEGGDIVLMDPGLRQVHVMSREDVVKSCEEFFCCAVYYWAVYEVSIEVA